jgi:hypothetical protein
LQGELEVVDIMVVVAVVAVLVDILQARQL